VKLRVLTYNIHKCIGGVDRKYDPKRIVDTVGHYQPDVLLLQEVDDQARRSNRDRQVEVLGEMLGMHHRSWFANVKVRGGGEYGNAVLARYPVVSTVNVDLTVAPKKRRSVLHAELRIRHDDVHRAVHVYNMHLGLAQYERKIQLRTFLASHPFAGLHHETPIIVGGDFNDVWGSLGKLLLPEGFRGVDRPPKTFPAWAPMRALDSIYVRGAAQITEVARGETQLAKRASDHRPLYADVVITGNQPVAHAHDGHARAETHGERRSRSPSTSGTHRARTATGSGGDGNR
jgi:endonuclease/exonuclease/phosphatase family metal-dependent hydrolase